MVVSFCIHTNNSSCCLAFLPEIAIVSFLVCSHSNRYITVSSCFNLHFSNDKLCWASFHMLPCHLCIFFGEACSDLFPIFKLVCLFSCSVLESSLYMLNTSSGLCFANIFSQSVVCLLTPLHEKFFNLNKVQRTNFFFYGSLFSMEIPVLWLPDAQSWHIGKDPDAGKDWGQEEKVTTEDEMVGWHHWLNGHGFG